MSEEYTSAGESAQRICREELPNGRWKAWLRDAPTTFAYGASETQAMANLTMLCLTGELSDDAAEELA